jgi:CRISPR-associated protein Cmr3
MLYRLSPRRLDEDEVMDSLPPHGLLPLRFTGAETYGKPPKETPSFWSWSQLQQWLEKPEDKIGVDPEALGIPRLPVETRVHLAIQPGERVGIDGMFFQTSGLRFLQCCGKKPLRTRQFALSVQFEEASVAGRALTMEPQIAPLGGERRLARWSPAAAEWPRMPQEVREKIVATRRLRLLLLTPAIFEKGCLPGWSRRSWPLGGDAEATVRAAAVPRPAILSGWNLETGQPKPTRRLAAAGSVYFLELQGTDEAVRQWCDAAWLGCVSDDEQDRRDGFGLAALGTWEDA